MEIELTDQERQLLFQTVTQSQYAGQLAVLVVSVLAKLRGPDEESSAGPGSDWPALLIED